MLVEDCDMCDMDCIVFMCGNMLFGCGAVGPGWLGCVIAMCGLSVLGCCVFS